MENGLAGWLSIGAAAVLAIVFVVAAVAKLRDRSATAKDFASLGLPAAEVLAVAIPLLELATAAVLLVAPGWGGVVAFGLLAAFTANLVVVIRSGRVATCACFGGRSAEPVGSRHLWRNAALLALALTAAVAAG